jgi:hypothetical protein
VQRELRVSFVTKGTVDHHDRPCVSFASSLNPVRAGIGSGQQRGYFTIRRLSEMSRRCTLTPKR